MTPRDPAGGLPGHCLCCWAGALQKGGQGG